jgi:kynurenine formamidase
LSWPIYFGQNNHHHRPYGFRIGSAAERPDDYRRGVTSFVDLSHEIRHGMLTYPGLPGPVISDHLARAESRAHYAAGTEFHIGHIEMVANTGTYLDTPFHRFPDGHDVAALDLARVADLPGVLIDATGSVEASADLLEGVDVAGRAVLVYTGWDRHWGTPTYGSPEHPYLGLELVRRLIDGGAVVVGIDAVNVDDTRTGARPVHTELLAAGILIVEHLQGLDRLAGATFRFTAVPAAVVGMGSFPVRAYATVDPAAR